MLGTTAIRGCAMRGWEKSSIVSVVSDFSVVFDFVVSDFQWFQIFYGPSSFVVSDAGRRSAWRPRTVHGGERVSS